MTEKRPQIGIAVIVTNINGEVLMSKRKTELGFGEWQFTGGHLEYGETFEACAKREALEETGLTINNVEQTYVQNYLFEDLGLHYVVVYMRAQTDDVFPKNMEPEKHEDWKWIAADTMPSPLYAPVQAAIESGLSIFK